MRRPEHVDRNPDFWLLSQILIDQDAVRDNQTQPFEDQVGAVVDLEVIQYVAMQRALRVAQFRPKADQIAIAAAWLDAFMTGARYQAMKQQEDRT